MAWYHRAALPIPERLMMNDLSCKCERLHAHNSQPELPFDFPQIDRSSSVNRHRGPIGGDFASLVGVAVGKASDLTFHV
jgi:hypothetical protein